MLVSTVVGFKYSHPSAAAKSHATTQNSNAKQQTSFANNQTNIQKTSKLKQQNSNLSILA
jgi:hypothetical protein